MIGPDVTKAITAPIPPPAHSPNTQALGLVLYTQYVYFFQTAGVILLVAMIGAIVLTLHHKPNVRRQIIADQVARTQSSAIEIVKVKSGQGRKSAMIIGLGHYLSVAAIVFTLGVLGNLSQSQERRSSY